LKEISPVIEFSVFDVPVTCLAVDDSCKKLPRNRGAIPGYKRSRVFHFSFANDVQQLTDGSLPSEQIFWLHILHQQKHTEPYL
jgi:hypothetical protein